MRPTVDTHVLVFLCEGRPERLGRRGRRSIERHGAAFSPAVRLELAFLKEIGRIRREIDTALAELIASGLAAELRDPFDAVAARAVDMAWTRDPFDRLITAHAALLGAPLVTQDPVMRANYGRAVW